MKVKVKSSGNKKLQLTLKQLTFNMDTGITAEAIQQMIQQALDTQAEAHRKELAAQAAHYQISSAVPSPAPASPPNSSTRSTVPRGIRLNMGSPSSTTTGFSINNLHLIKFDWAFSSNHKTANPKATTPLGIFDRFTYQQSEI